MDLLLWLIILIFSAILHEVVHGLVADRLGDPTARLFGRLTLNPKAHIDPYMSILLPALLYFISGGQVILGGAKPVPVDPFNLKDGRKDVALVALSGPLTNLFIAAIGGSLLKLLLISHIYNGFFADFLIQVVHINISLAVFNLIPIPPLDGSKVFSLLLPEETAERYLGIGNMGIVFLLILLNTGIFGNTLFDIITAIRAILLP